MLFLRAQTTKSEHLDIYIDTTLNKDENNRYPYVALFDNFEYLDFVINHPLPDVNTYLERMSTEKRPSENLIDLNEPAMSFIQKLDRILDACDKNIEQFLGFSFVVAGVKASFLFKQNKIFSGYTLEMRKAADDITVRTEHPLFKYTTISVIFAIEAASKIHCDALSSLLYESSAKLVEEYVSDLASKLYKDYSNMLMICERAPLLLHRYKHLLKHMNSCLELYEDTRKSKQYMFLQL